MIIDSPIVSGSYAGTGSLNQVGNVAISGSLTVTGSIIGNLTGTASYATTASYALNTTSASYAATASYAANVPETSSYAINALSASYAANATSASYAANSTSASYAVTASYSFNAVSASYAQTASYATNIIISGSIANVDYIDFDLTASFASALGRLGYDSGEGTLQFGLAGGNVTLNIGEDLYQYCYNAETSSMTKGQVVYVSGSQGNRIAVRLADNSADRASASTLGFVAETITAGGQGWVMTEGNLRKLNTVGLIGGKLLFLGSTPGTYTQTPPVAPAHGVRLGYAERIDNTVGSIYVKIDNGYELGELHDVRDTTTTSSYGDLFVKSGSLWINSKQLTGSYGVTGSITATSLSATSLTASNALITNNLAVNGTASFNYVQTITGSAVIIGQEYIILNTQIPASRYAGIKVYDSGSNSTSSIVWDSLTDHWVYENASGSVYSGGGFLAGPKNTGSLGDIIYPTQYRILRSQGDDHVYDSNIIDNDTAVKIGINTEITGGLIVSAGITGSLLGTASFANNATSASYAATATNADTASFVTLAQTASFVTTAQTASFVTTAQTASFVQNAQTASFVQNAQTASFVTTAQTASFVANAQTASYVLNAVSASFASTASFVTTAQTASFVTTAQTASFVQNAQTASFVTTAQTASFVQNAQSASVATSASQAQNAVSASYSTFAVTSSYSLAGSGFPFSGSAVITGSLLVTNLEGTGSRYLVTDASGNITAQSASAAIKTTQAFTATAGQTTFAVTNGYSTGYVDVFINGSKLNATEFTDTSGTNIVLATGSFANDIVEVVKYLPASGVSNNVLRQQTTFTASAGQTVFSASYTPGLLDIFYNGSKLAPDDFTANNGTFFTLATASAANDIIDVFVYSYQVGAFSGIGGVGTASQIAYFNTSNSITGSPNFTISGSTMTVTGSLIVSGSGTFTNIGPAVFSGSITSTEGFTGSFSGTASFAQTASFVTLAQTASFVTTAQTASFVTTAQTASFVTLAQTASFVANAQSASNAVTAQTASFANSFTVANILTAQTLVVQTITSSQDFVTGSTRFGSLLSNTHVFSGSVTMNPNGLFVSSSGNVGISTINPQTPLQILKDTNTNGTSVEEANMAFTVLSAAGQSKIAIGACNAGNYGYVQVMQDATSWTNRALVLQPRGGNVGIGVTSPRVPLDLGSANNRGQVIVLGETGTNNRVGFGLDSGTAGMRIFTVNNSSQFIDLGGISTTDGTTWTRNHRFGIAGGNTWLNEQGGNVGIGDTSPQSGLYIAKYGSNWDGDSQYTKPTGNIFLSMGYSVSNQDNWFGIRGNYGSSTGTANILLQANYRDIGSQAGHYITSKGIGLGAADFEIGKLTTSVSVSNPPTKVPQLYITSGGSVGIGTTDLSGTKLRVEGGELRVTTNNAGVAAYYSGGNGEVAAYNWGGSAWIPLSYAGQSHTWKVSGTEAMRISSGRNIGIGTDTPLCRLHIGPEGSVGGQTPVILMSTAAGTKPVMLITEYTARSGAFGYDSSNFLTLATEASVTAGIKFKVGSSFQSGLVNTGTEAMTIAGSGAVTIPGSLSKGSGSFRIKHPLASKKDTHQLVHSFIEGPQADLIYRGKIRLVAGRATVNIDEAATMTEGTFEALCREVQCFTSNETSWDAVRGKVEGNILTIECQNTESTDEISWLVIGERQDEHMMDTNWTDSNGKVIVEPLILEEETTI